MRLAGRRGGAQTALCRSLVDLNTMQLARGLSEVCRRSRQCSKGYHSSRRKALSRVTELCLWALNLREVLLRTIKTSRLHLRSLCLLEVSQAQEKHRGAKVICLSKHNSNTSHLLSSISMPRRRLHECGHRSISNNTSSRTKLI